MKMACWTSLLLITTEGIPGYVVAYVIDCDITVSEFELKSQYYLNFQNTNTICKDISRSYPPPAKFLIVPLMFFYKHIFSIE